MGVEAPNYQYPEDIPHVSGDRGTAALVVRKDAPASVAGTDGDYTLLQVDANGFLRVVFAADEAGLTDAELRATPVPVSGPLTDAQLRATPVPVSGTVAVQEPLSVDDNGGSLTVDGTVTVGAPAAADILAGKQSFTVTTAVTTLITIPAGRTWVGTIGASLTCEVAAASTVTGKASANFSTAGTGVIPGAGTYLTLDARCGANAATGTVGSQAANFGFIPFVVVAPAGNDVTIRVDSTNTGTSSRVDTFAAGRLF